MGLCDQGKRADFFMCSGALLLDPNRELTLKKLYARNLLRIVLAMLVWAKAYKAYHLFVSGTLGMTSLLQACKQVLLFDQETHFYFIHIMIIVYAFLPVTRVFVRYASKNDMIYALVLWFLLGIAYLTVRSFWPFSSLSGIPAQWLINMTYAAIGYGILGYFLRCHPIPGNGAASCSGAASCLCLVSPSSCQRKAGNCIRASWKACPSAWP